MDKDGKKKLIVIIILALFIVSIGSIIVMLCLMLIPPLALLPYALINIAALAALVYYGKQRMDEINEGMDNDTDNY